MLVIFVKRTGKIKNVFSGELQHITTLYGDEAEDYALIWDEITIPDDNSVIRIPGNYQVNTKTRQLEILPSLNRYPTARI